jgi:hypothetical protein
MPSDSSAPREISSKPLPKFSHHARHGDRPSWSATAIDTAAVLNAE